MASESGSKIKEVKRRSTFPLSKALAFSVRSVRIRLGRMLIVLIGIVTAIAFMTTLIGITEILGNMPQLAEVQQTADMRQFHMWWIVVAFLISVAGITNALLLSVTERVKEIGTLKCLGAMSYHIMEIFLFEAIFLGLIGGSLGGILGLGFAFLNSSAQWGVVEVAKALSWMMVMKILLFAASVSMVLCFLSATLPVYFAARLAPAEAMRYEV